MVTTRLEIKDISQPFGVNIPVVITLNLADVREPDKRKASFSKTIELPATNEINKLFENIYEVNISTQYFNKNKKTPCKYFVNDILNFEGNLKLSKITLKPDKSIVYEVNIVGEGGTLFVNIGEKLIKDNPRTPAEIAANVLSADNLDFSAYDHTYNRATQISSRTAYADGVNVRYPFIDRGTNGGLDTVFNTTDFLPCFHLYEYILKIITKAGYTFTSSILSSAEFKKYLLYPNIINVPLTQAQLENKQWYVGLLGNQSVPHNAYSDIAFTNKTTNGFFDLGNQLDPSNYFIKLNASGYYNVCARYKIKFRFTHTDPLVAKIQATLETVTKLNRSDNGGISFVGLNLRTDYNIQFVATDKKDVNTDYFFTADIATGEYFHAVNAQLYVSFYSSLRNIIKYFNSVGAEITPVGTLSYTVDLIGGTSNTSFYGLCTQKNIVAGDPLVCNSALPIAIKQKDLLKSVFQALNLYVDNDPLDKNNLIIESFDPFYNTTTPVNFENKTDLLKDITVNPNLLEGKKYSFTYKKDADHFNTLYQNEFNEAFGTESVNTESDFTQTEVKNEIIFSPTPNAANYGLGIAHPRIYKYNNNLKSPIASNIRWLYNGGVKQTANPITYQEQGTSDIISNDYLYCGMEDDAINPTLSLSFGIPKKVYYSYINAYFTNNNFYNRFQKFYLDTLIGRDSKIVTKYLWLSPKDINEFSFRNRIFNDGAYWIVNKVVNYDALQENSTLCELVKLNKSVVFVPAQTLISGSSVSAGVDVSTARLNSSLNVGNGNQNLGKNSLAVGENIIIPSSASNVIVMGNNIAVPEDTSNFIYLNGQVISSVLNDRAVCKSVAADYNVSTWDDTILMTTGATNRAVRLIYTNNANLESDITYTDNSTVINYLITKRVTIKKVDSGSGDVVISANGALIDGSATLRLTSQYESVILQWDGTNWAIVSNINDTYVAVKQVEVDFGTTPVSSLVWTVTDADVIVGSLIVPSVAYEAPTGEALDKLRAEGLNVIAGNTAIGSFQLFITPINGGTLSDKFKINYIIN